MFTFPSLLLSTLRSDLWQVYESIKRNLNSTYVAWVPSDLDYLFETSSFLPDFDILDEFQWKLFKILVFIVIINLFLIWVAWRVYGESITEKFLRPSSSLLLIEELKQSIAELKLPKEHSPRL